MPDSILQEARWGVHEVLTAPQSPWQNAFGQRLIGSIRRDCLDHVILSEAGLRRILKSWKPRVRLEFDNGFFRPLQDPLRIDERAKSADGGVDPEFPTLSLQTII